MKRQLILLLACMCMVTYIFAQPTVTNVSGTVRDGQTITINGSGFGNSGPNIVIYDEFDGANATENGDIPLSSPAIGSWDGNSNEPKYHATSHSGDYGFALNRGPDNFSQLQYRSSNPFTEVFLSYWVKLPNGIMPSASSPGEWNHASNWKMSWIYEGSTGYGGDNDICMPTWISPGTCSIGGNDQAGLRYASAPNSSKSLYLNSGWLTFTHWARFTIHMRADISNLTGWTSEAYVQTINDVTGQYEKIMDDALIFDDDYRSETNIQTKQWDRINMPGWIGNWDGNRGHFDGVYDDIYIATGPGAAARVEIGNAASYSACTNLALTTPVSWSDNTITTTTRTGSFNESDTVYLYVIDKDYNVNTTGYPVIIDGSSVSTHTITASAGTGGSIAPNGTVQVTKGADQSFTITADSGYEISDVTVDGVSQGVISSYTFTDVQAAHTITASFAAIGSDIIIDNEGAGTSQSGSWSSSSHFPGYYGSSYMYAPNSAGHWYEWSTSLAAGTYEVYAWWTADSGRPSDAVYDISHSGGTANVTADQTSDGGQWNLLGTYTFGTTAVVRLNSSANGPEGACADAIKFVEVPSTEENLALHKAVTVSGEPEPANPGTSAVDGIVTTRWSASGGYPQWLEVDLGDIYDIDATELVCYEDRAYQFTIDIKTTTGGAYTQVVDRSGNTQGGSETSPIRDDFTAISARYVRITITGADQYVGSWTSLKEFRVFGIGVPINLRTGISTTEATIPATKSANPKEDLKAFFSSSGLEVYYGSSLAPGSNGKALVGVYNMRGQLIQQVPTEVGSLRNGITCNSSQLEDGLYIVRVVTARSNVYTRAMLIR